MVHLLQNDSVSHLTFGFAPWDASGKLEVSPFFPIRLPFLNRSHTKPPTSNHHQKGAIVQLNGLPSRLNRWKCDIFNYSSHFFMLCLRSHFWSWNSQRMNTSARIAEASWRRWSISPSVRSRHGFRTGERKKGGWRELRVNLKLFSYRCVSPNRKGLLMKSDARTPSPSYPPAQQVSNLQVFLQGWPTQFTYSLGQDQQNKSA